MDKSKFSLLNGQELLTFALNALFYQYALYVNSLTIYLNVVHVNVLQKSVANTLNIVNVMSFKNQWLIDIQFSFYCTFFVSTSPFDVCLTGICSCMAFPAFTICAIQIAIETAKNHWYPYINHGL